MHHGLKMKKIKINRLIIKNLSPDERVFQFT